MPVTNYHSVNGVLIGESTGGVRTDYLTDALGSVTATMDQSANIKNTYRYKPYGDLLAKTGTDPDPKFMWNGSTGSRKTGLANSGQYNINRHYGTEQAAWTSRDPLWPDELAYVYVRGNPTSATDQFGMSPLGLQIKPPDVCPQNLQEAQRMIEAAFAAGGSTAARLLMQRLIQACPYLAAAIIGWYVGRFIDEKCGISNAILNLLYPQENNCPVTEEQILERRRQAALDVIRKRKTDRKNRTFCVVTCQHRIGNSKTACDPETLCAGAAGPNCVVACKAAKKKANDLASSGCNAGHCKTYCPDPPSQAAIQRCFRRAPQKSSNADCPSGGRPKPIP